MARLALSALATVLLTLSDCGREAAPPPSPSPSPPAASSPGPEYRASAYGVGGKPVQLKNLDRGGRLVYLLTAKSAQFSTERARGTLHGARLFFYKGSDKGSATRLEVTAPTADYDQKSNNVVLRDGVTAKNDAGATMVADTMAYNDTTRLLTASGHVTVTDRAGNVLSGDRAVADLDLQQLQMTGNIGVEGFGTR